MAGKKLSTQDLETFAKTLQHMLGVISGDIQHLESEALAGGAEASNVSSEDVGAEVSAMELSLELLERDEKTVREIMDALDRIKDGTYGKCETCESWIRKTRLGAVPHARNCIDCQRAAEERSH